MKILRYNQFLIEAKNPCWKGYKQVGTKKKNGKTVPNCVPLGESEEDEESFSFDELSKEAQEKAIDKNREINTEMIDWWDPIIEGYIEELSEIGVDKVDIEFMISYSQGDGASFTGIVNDNKKFLRALQIDPLESILKKGKIPSEKIKRALDEIIENIYIYFYRTDSRYHHENTVSAEVEVDGDDEIELDLGLGYIVPISVQDECERLQPLVQDWLRKKCKEIYRSIEKYLDELQSEEAVAEDLRSGGYRFDKDGNII